MAINTKVPRGPAQLRDVLEVRVRRMSSGYSRDERLQALHEMRELIDSAIQGLEEQDA